MLFFLAGSPFDSMQLQLTLILFKSAQKLEKKTSAKTHKQNTQTARQHLMYKIRVYSSAWGQFFWVNFGDFHNADGDLIFHRNTDKYGWLATLNMCICVTCASTECPNFTYGTQYVYMYMYNIYMYSLLLNLPSIQEFRKYSFIRTCIYGNLLIINSSYSFFLNRNLLCC